LLKEKEAAETITQNIILGIHKQRDDYMAEHAPSSDIETFILSIKMKSLFLTDLIQDLTQEHSCTYKFPSFRELFDDFISKNNRELSRYLKDSPTKGENLHIFQRDQQKTFLKRKIDNQWQRLSEDFSMRQIAAKQVNEFVLSSNFHPQNTAIIFPSPGNWINVLEFNLKFPSSKSLIIETQPDVILALRDHCMIAHALSPECIVVVDDPQLRRQEKILKYTLDKWITDGLNIIVFENPYTKNCPMTLALTSKTQALIETIRCRGAVV